LNRVIITGSNGCLGTALCRIIAEKWPSTDLYCFDIHEESVKKYKKQTYFEVNLLNGKNLNRLINEISPDVIFHFAGSFNHDDVDELYGSNVIGTVNLLKAVCSCKDPKKPRVIIAGSAAVYEQRHGHKISICESDPILPLNHYGVTKAAMEMAVNIYSEIYGADVTIVRLFNLLGPGLSPRLLPGRLAKEVAEIREGRRDPVFKVGNQDSIRDYLDVRDAADACIKLVTADRPQRIYNLASGTATMIRDLINMFAKTAGRCVRVIEEPALFKSYDIEYAVADITRIKNDLDWSPQIPIEESVVAMVK
jgi:nucleoside-diphosphate-sugar epimerase